VVDGDLQAQGLALAPDEKSVVFASVWSSELPEIRVASLGRARSLRALSAANAKLAARVEFGRTERITYASSDGLEIEAFVVYPPGAGKARPGKSGARKGPHPTILEIHGGPHGAHPATFNMLRTQALAGAGYVVLLPNPRGSTSYGERFERGCIGDWGGGDYEDLMAGLDELVERKIADPKRLFASGYSYGGYMSSWMVGQTRRFRAAVIGAPITDLVSAFGTDDIPHYNIESMGGTPETHFEEYRKRSPLTYVQNVETPCLLLHWEGDLRCPIAQSEQFFIGLRLLGREAELVRYPGGAHGVRTPSQDVDYAERELAWFALHTPGN
jgi:dipeptidyl aminopeptidase/acylaminoacyl peptidase